MLGGYTAHSCLILVTKMRQKQQPLRFAVM